MRTYNEARACFVRLKLQGAPPCDVERARVFKTGFQAPRGGFLMRVRLSRRNSDVFKPRPGSRERFESRRKDICGKRLSKYVQLRVATVVCLTHESEQELAMLGEILMR